MSKYEVSIIFVIYNPVWEKTRITLNSIIKQKNVNLEIIICDDGSKINLLNEIDDYLKQQEFDNYRFVSHKENVGTVRNYYDGLCVSEGEYCYGISPGDMIYDCNAIADFYLFAKEHNSNICFGDAVYYSPEPEPHVLNKILNMPQNPYLYNDKEQNSQLISLYFNSMINGASYFRKTSIIKALLEEGLKFLKYVEDTPSSLLAITQGYHIDYFHRKILVYEYGTGISTGDNKWTNVVMNELIATYDYLKAKYPNNPIVDAAWYTIHNGRVKSIMYRVMKHPVILFKSMINKREKVYSSVTVEDEQVLSDLMSETLEPI